MGFPWNKGVLVEINVADGAMAIAIGAYLAVVIYNRNSAALLALLKQELGFAEWFAAIIILWYVATRSSAVGDVGKMLIFAAFLGLGIKLVSTPSIKTRLEDFAGGKTSLFGLLGFTGKTQ